MTTMTLLASCLLLAATTAPAERWSFVDDQGVLRWRDDNSEIALFGVNYYTPFTVDYQGIQALGLNHVTVINQDVSHFRRLGLDVIRLHVFDRQISDVEGNLIANEHLDLFDYLVATCKRQGLYTVLTPIAWWHYHFPDSGFSSLYTKPQMVLDPQARRAQATYLRQFMEHVNPYTKVAYKDEPAMVAIELINEPQYDSATTIDQIRGYIDELAAAVREAGAKQPIFYNGWGGKEEAVGQSTIEGCTFGWYPTGLVSGGCLRDNFLPIVDDFPGMRLDCLRNKAKIVYEFDAADVPGHVMYPAMARAFRSGGAQIATQFQYDPMPLAAFNYGWQTHYLNLVYTPAKAISFAIAAEVFRSTPRLQRFPAYPHNTKVGPLRLSYELDLSEMVTERIFLYANNTDTNPPAPEKLERIAGVGSSPVVHYDGTGAYFLDRIADGIWRLELYPDAVWVDDPFAATSLQREVSRVIWAGRMMQIELPDLGADFSYRYTGPSDSPVGSATAGQMSVQPGVYVLARKGVARPNSLPGDFHAPLQTHQDVAVWWQCPDVWRAGTPLSVAATVAASDVQAVRLHLASGEALPLRDAGSYIYRTEVPGDRLQTGLQQLQLEVTTPSGTYWFPRATGKPPEQSPASRPALDVASRTIEMLPADAPVPLFVAGRHRVRLEGQENRKSEVVAGSAAGRQAVRVSADRFDASPSAIYFRNTVPESTRAWHDALGKCNVVVVTARAHSRETDRVELVLLEKDSAPWGTEVTLTPDWQEIVIPLNRLRFFPHWVHPAGRGSEADHFQPEQVGAVNICFGAWLYGDRSNQPHGFEVESITLDQRELPLQILPLRNIHVDSAFWSPKLNVYRRQTIPHSWQYMGWELRALKQAVGEPVEGDLNGTWGEANLYKFLETCAYSLAQFPDPALTQQVNDVIRLLGRAQQPDGYLHAYVTNNQKLPWDPAFLDGSHDGYVLGHMIEAAIEYHAATGQDEFLQIARRAADQAYQHFLGPAGVPGFCGHAELEMALVELYRVTRETRYLELATAFVEWRGRGKVPPCSDTPRAYFQDAAPLRQQKTLEGHAVRAIFFATGVADLALETGSGDYRLAAHRFWDSTARRRMTITGCAGPRQEHEAFGEDFELPHDGYYESCVACGLADFAQRMFLLERRSEYADVLERVLYNAVLHGMSLDGKSSYYQNPLSDRDRPRYNSWVCCPPNLSRTLLQIGRYAVAYNDTSIYVNLFVGGSYAIPHAEGTVTVNIQTNYPWDGAVQFEFTSATSHEVALCLRIPDWCRQATLACNDQSAEAVVANEDGYFVLPRKWQPGDRVRLNLDMPPVWIEAHPNIRSCAGRIALQRGPLVYAFEGLDNGGNADFLLGLDPPVETRWREDLLGGVTVLTTQSAEGRPLSAIPFYALANRENSCQEVWRPQQGFAASPHWWLGELYRPQTRRPPSP